jgi:cytochrome c-type biogenesis protein
METLLESLSRAVQGGAGGALAASLIWGVLGVFSDPIHVVSIPLTVAFVAEQSRVNARRGSAVAALMVAGVVIALAAVGVATSLLRQPVGQCGCCGSLVAAAVFFVLGLHLLGVIPGPWAGLRQRTVAQSWAGTAFALGLIYGWALAPSTFEFIAPILNAAGHLVPTRPIFTVALFLACAIGFGGVVVLVATATGLLQQRLNWTERSIGTVIVRRICGVLILLGAVYLLTVSL